MNENLTNQAMTQFRFLWVIPEKTDLNDACYLARVYYPHLRLQEYGISSRIITESSDISEYHEADVVIFHRTTLNMSEVSKLDKVIGIDLMDDLFRYKYIKADQDFLLTDSLPNTRFYHSRNTYYWPHAFNIHDDIDFSESKDDVVNFVYCGNAGNVQCLLGAPLNALERLGKERAVKLTIITNIKTAETQSWIGHLPDIKPENYSLEWIEFDINTYEHHMKQCDVGYFPQDIQKDRWKKKSIYKTAHASSIGLPAIVSPTEEAFSTYTHRLNCMIAYSEEDWYRAAKQMADPVFRGTIKANAVELCKLKFNFDLICNQLLGIVEIYLNRKRESRIYRKLVRHSAYFLLKVEHYIRAIKKRL